MRTSPSQAGQGGLQLWLPLLPLPSLGKASPAFSGADGQPLVIHTVGPIAQGQPSPSQQTELSDCYKNSLKLALENKLQTVAFPCISTGVFGYPNDDAAEVVLNTLHNWLEDNKDKVERLIVCVFLEKDDEIYKEKLPKYFPIDAGEEPPSSKL
ncbi:O-acetyl-ADP-ribose deacetylase MACROD1-like [Pseudonaja textilis]|uniref:O-acetyl-ADP-ribose deacetylase MACROD1-like n=1 Tax=Pseudonaja textilis TaxID=8673 RepID=UPI000EAA6B29|nr:O-acetyl-ADP-ribose deacetylase MACROD1-like [Pseudonaja textilis]XP_026580343.1 O-acetyl-ADP-ribose deacetylase MACROD1-like [Pseudonaja textilis]